MSSNLVIALTKMTLSQGLSTLSAALDVLIERFQFGFRGTGRVLQLVFDDKEFIEEQLTDESVDDVRIIGRSHLDRFAKNLRWFSIGGSVRLEGVDNLVDLDTLFYPTFDAQRPVCIAFRCQSALYDAVYGDDFYYDEQAADRLIKLCVALGTIDGADGFQAREVADIGEIRAYDGPALSNEILRPRSVQHSPGPGLVLGVRTELCSLGSIRDRWKDGKVFTTSTGFSILSTLVDFRIPLASTQ